jgi:hypothetical protein
MLIRRGVGRRGRVVIGLAGWGALVLAGCNLGVPAVGYELVDPEAANWPLGPTGAATGDVDGDGDLDVVATGFQSPYAVLANDGSGALAIDFPDLAGPSKLSPSLADVDGDTDLDLVSQIENLNPRVVVPAVRRNDGSGAFGPMEVVQPVPPPGALGDLVVADADGDGDVDLLAAILIAGGRHVGAYLNDGTGTFGPPVTSPLGFTSEFATEVHLVVGDLEGDGDVDVVATDIARLPRPGGETSRRTIALVARNDGAGAFAAAGGPIEVGAPGFSDALEPALTDLDDDGSLDLAVGGPGSITTLLGDGAGGFAAPVLSVVPDTRGLVDAVAPADIDDDGHVDLVGFDDMLSAKDGVVVYGDGAGGVADAHSVGTGAEVGGDGTPGVEVEVLDLDGDGDDDILFLAGTLGVVENATDGSRPNH